MLATLGAGLAALAGCSSEQTDVKRRVEQGAGPVPENQPSAPKDAAPRTEDHPSSPEAVEASDSGAAVLAIGSQRFDVALEDNAAARELAARFPLALSMGELNGNEKFAYLDGELPSSSSAPGTIEAGDLMLYGSNCLVLFYEGHASSYRYTRLGRVDSSEHLAQALGSGSVDVSFEPR